MRFKKHMHINFYNMSSHLYALVKHIHFSEHFLIATTAKLLWSSYLSVVGCPLLVFTFMLEKKASFVIAVGFRKKKCTL